MARRQTVRGPCEDIQVQAVIPFEDLIHQLASNGRDEMVQLVIGIDETMADWDFTLRLCEHFAALKLQYEIEVAADAAAASRDNT